MTDAEEPSEEAAHASPTQEMCCNSETNPVQTTDAELTAEEIALETAIQEMARAAVQERGWSSGDEASAIGRTSATRSPQNRTPEPAKRRRTGKEVPAVQTTGSSLALSS